MTASLRPIQMEGLAARLNNLEDREAYAALMCYLTALPEGDEFRKLAELLGLLSLVGQRIPDAIADLLVECRAQASSADRYRQELQERLAKLPEEITAGIDSHSIAKAMGESFRQQLAHTSLQESASLLKAASITLKTLSAEITASLQPTAINIAAEVERLNATTRLLQEQNSRLFHGRRRSNNLLFCIAGLFLFLLGFLCRSSLT